MSSISSFIWLPVCVILFFVSLVMYPHIVLLVINLVLITGMLLVVATLGHIVWSSFNDNKGD